MFSFRPQYDRFGILQLAPSVPGGRNWCSTWDNTIPRLCTSGDFDRCDAEFQARGSGTCIDIDGQGIARVSGASPRMYVYRRGQTWKNVEVTFYAQRIDEYADQTSQGWVCGARSEHQDHADDPALARGYYGRMLYSGRIHFAKEFWHRKADNLKIYGPNRPSESEKYPWDTCDGQMPREKWLGYKYLVRNTADDREVHLDLHLDQTQGRDGGTWEPIVNYVDRDDTDWPPKVPLPSDYPETRVWREAATSVFVRNDALTAAEYKWFSIREVEPIS